MPGSPTARTEETPDEGFSLEAVAQERPLAEHAPPARLVAQRGLFRGPDPVCPDDLYAQIRFGAAVRERRRLVVHPGSEVTLDTYFGRFPASYWQRWTVVESVEIGLVVTGSGRVSLIASDEEGETRTIAVEEVTDARGTEVRLTADLDKFIDGGFVWVDFAAEDADLVVERMTWSVAPPELPRPTAVVICTFNRADDCTKTLQSLSRDDDALEQLDAVYVVDQGTDTVESRPGFDALTSALGGRLRYLRQPNLGGAGGFGRGMYEVTEAAARGEGAEHANVLLMDDDVLCEPEIVIRLSAFANRTVEPTIVGGQMLRLLHPTHLLAGAEYADFAQLLPGQVAKGALEDVDLLAEGVDEDGEPTGKPNRGDVRVDADYNAWWSCLIPAEVVTRIGLPLPVFFQWDDVEYGYRARAEGISTVTLPGAGLWHADFDWKDSDKWNEYFAVRNALIVSSLHAEIDAKQFARVVVSRIVRYLLEIRYGLAATVLKAVDDFLNGPEFLHDGGATAAREIHALRATYPDTVMHKAADLPKLAPGAVRMAAAGATPNMTRVMLVKRLIKLALGRSAPEVAAIAKKDATWWHVSQFNTVVVTDGSQGGVRLRRRDREQTVKIVKETARVVKRLLSDLPRVREEYRAAVPGLTSRENWRRLYDLR